MRYLGAAMVLASKQTVAFRVQRYGFGAGNKKAMLGQIYSLTLASDSLPRMSFNLRSSLTAIATKKITEAPCPDLAPDFRDVLVLLY